MTSATIAGQANPVQYLQAQNRWQWSEIAFWLATLLPFVLTPNYLVLASQIAITALFVLSLDLILGFSGIVSLGHAAYFGIGAYTAGLLSKYGWGEPLTGLVAAAIVAGLFGYLTSFIIARFRHLALIMITLGIGLVLQEAANSAGWLTGGFDGLQGIHTWPLFGKIRFDLYGYTAYSYALAGLFLIFLVARRLIHSPFGLALRGIRENGLRMPAIGASVHAHIQTIYTIAAIIAGIAGALLAQTTETVSLEALGFQRSADVLVMLILGGTGRLYGGLIGAAVYMVARDQFSGINPQYWYFWIGLLLIGVVMLLPNGILGGLTHSGAAPEGGVVSANALATRGLNKSFGSLVVASDIELNLPQGVRYALIGPNGAGKTTLINLMTGMLQPDGGRIFLGDDDITALPPEQRVRLGLVRTFQINQLFPHLTALESVTLAVCERRKVARTWWRQLTAYRDEIDEAYDILATLGLAPVCHRLTRELAYGQQRLVEIALALATKPKVLLLDEPAAGVPREESRELLAAIAGLSRDITVLFIEHDMDLVFRFASRVIVMVGGRVLVEGTPAEIAADPRVRAVYLGKARHEAAS